MTENRDGLLGSAEDDQDVHEEGVVDNGPEVKGAPYVTANSGAGVGDGRREIDTGAAPS